MKTMTTTAAQGDVLFRRIAALPPGVVPVPRDGGKLIVTHSETGHHHSIIQPDHLMFEVPGNPLIAYLQLGDGNCDVVHEREWSTHETMRLLGGLGTVIEVRRQRESTPDGWKRVED